MITKKNKRGFIEFSWIFAVIVGAVFLFLAFYFIGSKLMLERQIETTKTSHNINILITPFSSIGAIAEASSKMIEMPKEAEIEFTYS